MKVRFSDHALLQMNERGTTRSEVVKAIELGEEIIDDPTIESEWTYVNTNIQVGDGDNQIEIKNGDRNVDINIGNGNNTLRFSEDVDDMRIKYDDWYGNLITENSNGNKTWCQLQMYFVGFL